MKTHRHVPNGLRARDENGRMVCAHTAARATTTRRRRIVGDLMAQAEAAVSERGLAFLRDVAADNVTWTSNISGRRSFRLWSSERDYVTCTKIAKRAEGRGFIKTYYGWSFGRGGVELTPAGRAILERAAMSTDEEG